MENSECPPPYSDIDSLANTVSELLVKLDTLGKCNKDRADRIKEIKSKYTKGIVAHTCEITRLPFPTNVDVGEVTIVDKMREMERAQNIIIEMASVWWIIKDVLFDVVKELSTENVDEPCE